MNIYIRKEGRRDGPFSPKQAGEFIRQGRYSLSDLAWHEGMHEWSPIHALPDVVTFVLPPIPVKKQVLSPALPTAEQIPDIPASAQSPIIMPPIFHKTSGWPLFFVVCIIGFFGGVAGAMLSDSTGNEWGLGFIIGAAISVLVFRIITGEKVEVLQQKNKGGDLEATNTVQPETSPKPLLSEQSEFNPELTNGILAMKTKTIIFFILWGGLYLAFRVSSGCFAWGSLIVSFCFPGLIFGIVYLQDMLKLSAKNIKPLLPELSKTSHELTNVSTVKCPYCGAKYPAGTIVCPHDNTTLSTNSSEGNVADDGVISILVWFGIALALAYWYFTTNDASMNPHYLPLLRFITTILTKGHSHE